MTSVRFVTPADRLRALGKLGPYGDPPEGPAPVAVDDSVTALEVGAQVDAAEVRAWAQAHGIDVSRKGPIKGDVIDAYRQAHEG